jgi:hypothetical protein
MAGATGGMIGSAGGAAAAIAADDALDGPALSVRVPPHRVTPLRPPQHQQQQQHQQEAQQYMSASVASSPVLVRRTHQ